jgi:hypothetical protein
MVGKEQVIIKGIRLDEWVNPFGATQEELVASALDDSGLMQSKTTINGKEANAIFQSYCKKKNLFQEATRLGNILLKESIISQEQLTEALKIQMETGRPLGEVLVTQNICTEADIERGLAHQQALREDLYRLEQEKENRKNIWRRIIGFLIEV